MTSKISVVIPAYNAEKYIKKTLDSVFRQTVFPHEVIVVDDGSADATVSLVEQYQVKLIKQKNRGAAAARNTGVSCASGNWIAFLDADDEWLPNKIEEVVKTLESIDQDVVIIATDKLFGNDQLGYKLVELHRSYAEDKSFFDQLFLKSFLSTSTLTVKKKSYVEQGGMDESIISFQDYDMWLRLARIGALKFIPIPLSRYVVRPNSLSSRPFRSFKGARISVLKHLDIASYELLFKKMIYLFWTMFLASRNNSKYIDLLFVVIVFPFFAIEILIKKTIKLINKKRVHYV